MSKTAPFSLLLHNSPSHLATRFQVLCMNKSWQICKSNMVINQLKETQLEEKLGLGGGGQKSRLLGPELLPVVTSDSSPKQ